MAKQVSSIVEFMDQILPTVQAFYHDRMYHLNGRKGLRNGTIKAVVSNNFERQVFDIYYVSPKPGTSPSDNQYIYEQFYIRADALFNAIQQRRKGQTEFDLEKFRLPFVNIIPNPDYKVDWASFENTKALQRRILNRVTKHYRQFLDAKTTEYQGLELNIACRLRFDPESNLVHAEEIRTAGDPVDITNDIDFADTLVKLKTEYGDQQWADAVSDIVPLFNRAFIWSQVCFTPPTAQETEQYQQEQSEAGSRLATKILGELQSVWDDTQDALYEVLYNANAPEQDLIVRPVLSTGDQLEVEVVLLVDGEEIELTRYHTSTATLSLTKVLDKLRRGMREDLWSAAMSIIVAEWDQHFPAVNLKVDAPSENTSADDDNFALDS